MMTKIRGLHGGRGVRMDNFLPGSTYTGRNLQMWGLCHFCQANAWHFFAKANSNSSACPFANRCGNRYLSHPQNTWHPTQTNFYQPKREKASKERCHLLLTLSRWRCPRVLGYWKVYNTSSCGEDWVCNKIRGRFYLWNRLSWQTRWQRD